MGGPDQMMCRYAIEKSIRFQKSLSFLSKQEKKLFFTTMPSGFYGCEKKDFTRRRYRNFGVLQVEKITAGGVVRLPDKTTGQFSRGNCSIDDDQRLRRFLRGRFSNQESRRLKNEHGWSNKNAN